MLKAVPKSWCSWDFEVLDEERPVADIEISFWGERGRFGVEGATYEVRREGWFGAFVLEAGGSSLARAEKPSLFHRSYVIDHAGRQYTLRPASIWGRSFDLVHGTRAVGALSLERMFCRRLRADLPEDLPLFLRVFVIWLALILWRRAAHAATAGAT